MKKLVSVLLIILSITALAFCFSGCNKGDASKTDAIVGTWSLSKSTYKSPTIDVNLKNEFDFYYYVFNSDGTGFMKYREVTTTTTIQKKFNYVATYDDKDDLVSVAISSAGVSSSYNYSKNIFSKGKLKYEKVSTTTVTFEDESTQNVETKEVVVLKKISHDVDVI